LVRPDDDRCRDVFKRAAAKPCVQLLPDTTGDARFIAAVLRLALTVIELTPEQWILVAEGGGRLQNNAIRNYALARAHA
jgi:hypothetical protein